MVKQVGQLAGGLVLIIDPVLRMFTMCGDEFFPMALIKQLSTYEV